MHTLVSLGWSSHFEIAMNPLAARGLAPARVVEEQRTEFRVVSPDGERSAPMAGKLRHESRGPEDLPAVGDWVAVDPAPAGGATVIRAVLPRRSALLRKEASSRVLTAQVIAANLDTVFVVASLNLDLSLRRIERYLALVWEGGAQPVVLLSKSDLVDDAPARMKEVEAVAPGAGVHAVSAATGAGLDALAPYLAPGLTVALVGSSGVGKSTLVNRLLGEERQVVRDVRESDDRGVHTTTSRRLFVLPSGGLLVDTPGMREVGMWGGATGDASGTYGSGIEVAFEDVAALAPACRFRDCRHESEPGCAVLAAVEGGSLPRERLAAYRKLLREMAHHARKDDPAAQAEQRRIWRIRAHALRRSKRDR